MEDFWIALGGGAALGNATKKVGEALAGPIAGEIGEDAKKAYVAVRDAATNSIVAIANHLRLIVKPELIGTATVRPQITMSVMQAAAGVDDPDLVQMFANLLASEMESNRVHPSYASIIGQMSGDEARLFTSLVRRKEPAGSMTLAFPDGARLTAYIPAGYSVESHISLERLGLVREQDLPSERWSKLHEEALASLRASVPTNKGGRLVRQTLLEVTLYGWNFASVAVPPPNQAQD